MSVNWVLGFFGMLHFGLWLSVLWNMHWIYKVWNRCWLIHLEDFVCRNVSFDFG